MKSIIAENSRELEKFADLMKRTVIPLKETNQSSQLQGGGGTLCATVAEKVPHSFLSQYYRWTKEREKVESLEELREWVTEEAEYQVQASEVKHGVCCSGRTHTRLPRSHFRTENRRDNPWKVRNEKHAVWKCDVLKGMESKKSGTQRRNWVCYRFEVRRFGGRRLQVNCFLDEGSDTTYVNEDVVEELGMKGWK